jgi:arylsulfatase A-like enzyme/Tfp pilus assembly protein PilF
VFRITVAAIAFGVLTASGQPPAGRVPPNVLLITIDTLRADRVGAYGYGQARTPAIDRLAAEGVRFADATAHAPLTLPSHVAIHTGRYPGAFGMRVNGLGRLPDSAVTVAERLKEAGYSTGAIVASAVLSGSYGLNQGFDDYDDRIQAPARATLSTAELQRDAADVTSAAKRWLEHRQAPWFLWVHYYDPHLPYEPPARFTSAAPNRPYDGEIAFVDAELGRLIEGLNRDRTIVVVTSDHGESLGQHGEADHGYFLYDATLSVPLIVRVPGMAARVVSEQVRLIDLAPTIAQLAGPGGVADATDGESLVPLMEGQVRRDVPISVAESWYPRLHFGWSEIRSARVGEWKYVAAPKPELYDLRHDRGELRNLASDRSAVAGRLAADLARVTARFAQPDAKPVAQPDAAAVERLQALGYLGAFAPVTAGGSGIDPKDRVEEYRQYRALFNQALGHLARGNAAQGAAVLQRLVKTNVRAFEAHLYLGNAYAALGRHDAALGEYEAAAQLNPGLATPHFEAAKVLSTKGDHAGAAARCRKGLDLEPSSFYGHYTLGVVHQRAQQWPAALAAFRRAVELNAADPRARANLASAAMRAGDLDLARQQFEQMIALAYQVAPAHYNLGVIAARQGQTAEAARRFRLALAADPAFKPAAAALAKLK